MVALQVGFEKMYDLEYTLDIIRLRSECSFLSIMANIGGTLCAGQYVTQLNVQSVGRLPIICETIFVEFRLWKTTAVNGLQSFFIAIDTELVRTGPHNWAFVAMQLVDCAVFRVGQSYPIDP